MIPEWVTQRQFEHLTFATPKQVTRWLAHALIQPKREIAESSESLRDAQEVLSFSRFDVALGALFTQLEQLRLRLRELRIVADYLHEGAATCERIDLPVPAIARALQIRMAQISDDDEDGFKGLAAAGIEDPFLKASQNFKEYASFVQYSRDRPSNLAMEVLHKLDMTEVWMASYYTQLMAEYDDADATTPFWDIVCEYDIVRIMPRDDVLLPWSIADGSEIVSFGTISLPALKRAIAAQAATLEM